MMWLAIVFAWLSGLFSGLLLAKISLPVREENDDAYASYLEDIGNGKNKKLGGSPPGNL